jgi:serine protease Do
MQTDCTLMAGDSGGPVFDMHGRVVGIHSRISDAVTENYHVPINVFLENWARLARGDSWGRDATPRPWLGTRGIDHLKGCELERVAEDGPAYKAGVRVGDIVLRIGGEKVASVADYSARVRATKPGDALTMTILRGEVELTFSMKVENRPRRE